MKKKTLPLNHFSIAKTLDYIGLTNDKQCNYEKALNYFNQSLEMKNTTLPSNHHSIATSTANLLDYIEILYRIRLRIVFLR